jgi:hypothetical protein
MLRKLNELWRDDDGFVVSSELVMYGTMGVIGVGAGYTAVRDTMNTELNDVAKALGSMDQSYYISGVSGHCSFTAGSAFFDRADRCDVPPLQQYVQRSTCADRPLVCADVFGRDGNVPPHVHSHVVPHAGPAAVVAPLSATTAPADAIVVREHGSKGVVTGQPPVGPGPHGHPHHAHGPHPHHAAPVHGLATYGYAEPYVVDVPEGYFNSLPPSGYIGPASGYHAYLGHRYGVDPRYVPPTAPVVVDAPAIIGVVPAPHGVHHRGEPRWNAIDLGFAQVGDAELKDIEKFKTAKCLQIFGSKVTDKGMSYIAELQQLESLYLIDTQITDAGLKEVAELRNLRFLRLCNTKITDAGLKHLVGLKHLEELECRGTAVTDEGLDRLRKALPTLRVIR